VDVSRLPATQPMTKGTACRSMSIPSPPHKASTSRSSRVYHLVPSAASGGRLPGVLPRHPPAVHRMIVTLHERGPIARVPGQPRRITWWSRPMICRGFNRSKFLRRGLHGRGAGPVRHRATALVPTDPYGRPVEHRRAVATRRSHDRPPQAPAVSASPAAPTRRLQSARSRLPGW
jgi:hypothetical protein